MNASLVVFALSTLAPAQFGQAPDEAAFVANPPPDAQPLHEASLPVNGHLYLLAYFDDASTEASIILGGVPTALTLTSTCGERDPYRCLLTAPLDMIEVGDAPTFSITNSDSDLSIDVTVGPEDLTPPPAIELSAGEVFFYPASGDVEASFFLSLLASDADPDIAVVELARSDENEAGDEVLTTLNYRLRAEEGLFGGDFTDTLAGAEARTACYRAIAIDLAGHRTQGERLCVDVSEENATLVEPDLFGGCACVSPADLSAPFGGMAVIVGLAWRVRRRRR